MENSCNILRSVFIQCVWNADFYSSVSFTALVSVHHLSAETVQVKVLSFIFFNIHHPSVITRTLFLFVVHLLHYLLRHLQSSCWWDVSYSHRITLSTPSSAVFLIIQFHFWTEAQAAISQRGAVHTVGYDITLRDSCAVCYCIRW